VDRIDFDQLDKVCRRLGEAVLEPAAWPALMEQICRPLGVAGAILLPTDVRTPDVPRTEAVDEMARAYFAGGWHTREIWTRRGAHLFSQGKKAFIDTELLTRDELEASPLVNEIFLPKGFKWAAAIGFSAGPAMWGLCLHRTARDEPFDAFNTSVFEPLSDRLTEIATLSTAVGRIALSSATNALNAVRHPAIALDRQGFVLDANRGAEDLFDADIYVKERRLAVWDAAASRDLEKLVECLFVTSDLATLPCAPIVVRRREKRPVILRILPVHGAARTPFLGARVLLTLTSLEPRPLLKTTALIGAFGLTPAEARLASVIAEGVSPEQAAEALGISRLTARNQLKAIFGKTDTHRQSELVALLSLLERGV
jgi:DNA-binding CsgD family transcriptional regulator/PAS domain-containing protein